MTHKETCQRLVDTYNHYMNTKFKLTEHLQRNMVRCLKSYSFDDCIDVMLYIINDDWHIENNYRTLDNIFRPTKFDDKFQKMTLAKLKKITTVFV